MRSLKENLLNPILILFYFVWIPFLSHIFAYDFFSDNILAATLTFLFFPFLFYFLNYIFIKIYCFIKHLLHRYTL